HTQHHKPKSLNNPYTATPSTKLRHVLDQATAGQLKPQLHKLPTPTTHRCHSQRIAAYNLPIYTSILFILGHNVDKPIDAWDESFLPLQMMQHLKKVTIRDGANSFPLIK